MKEIEEIKFGRVKNGKKYLFGIKWEVEWRKEGGVSTKDKLWKFYIILSKISNYFITKI